MKKRLKKLEEQLEQEPEEKIEYIAVWGDEDDGGPYVARWGDNHAEEKRGDQSVEND